MMNNTYQEKQPTLEELTVARSELTGGDTTGLVYARSSPGAAFMLVPRGEALRMVETKIGGWEPQPQPSNKTKK